MSPPVEIQALTVHRGDFTLDVPSLTVEPGSVVGLVGRNAAGKTTLLQVLSGQLAPTSGTARVFGLDPIEDLVAARHQVAWMSDDMPVFAMRIADHLNAVAPFWPTWDAGLAAELLRRFELDPRMLTAQLSKGEHTRFRLVLALCWRPKLVLLDEPATGLDVPSRRQMLAEVMGVVRDPERSVIISSHQAADIERIADRVLLIERGRIVADGAPHDVAGAGRTLEERLAGGAQ
jgi:ABC-2 type transport system ATP-binding protein